MKQKPDRQLIYEIEIAYPSKISITGTGKETFYFYDDFPGSVNMFRDFELPQIIRKKSAMVVYDGDVRTETISKFKRDPMYLHLVSSYEDPDPENNPLKNGKFSF